MLSCDFLPQILDVPPAPFVVRRAVRRLDFEQSRPRAALVSRKLAKIKLRVQRRIEPKRPLSATAAGLVAHNIVGVETLLAGGDDYEVLCTVPPAQSDALIAAGRAAGLAVTAIGTIVAGHERPRFLDGQGRDLILKRLSYSHF